MSRLILTVVVTAVAVAAIWLFAAAPALTGDPGNGDSAGYNGGDTGYGGGGNLEGMSLFGAP